MPYIKKENRKKYNKVITELVDLFREKCATGRDVESLNYQDEYRIPVGDINYVFSSVLWKLFDFKQSYDNGNDIVGVLSCIKHEFERRKLDEYEKTKILVNGDLE